MSEFSFLKKYRFINPASSKEVKSKHYFYYVENSHIKDVKEMINIPHELLDFWTQIGYGFFHKHEDYSFNRLLGPESFKIINLRQEIYAHDPDLELYDSEEYQNKLIFFEVNEGVYLLIDKEAKDGKNAIYYFDDRIADSLEEFLLRFDKEGHYFEKD
ncbi:MAG TPA: SMI1/KNR4 family protein [Aequorivita sp.]|nr:SMI1/KNR4 family protein [Aequorivita sp.]